MPTLLLLGGAAALAWWLVHRATPATTPPPLPLPSPPRSLPPSLPVYLAPVVVPPPTALPPAPPPPAPLPARPASVVPFQMGFFNSAPGLAALLRQAPAPAPPPDPRHEVLALTNAERARGGTCADPSGAHASSPPLAWDDRLAAAAQGHAAWMAANRTLAHVAADGDPGSRANAAGFAWSRVGENIAEGQRSPAEVVAAWRASTHGHCANLLDPGFAALGVGLAYTNDGTPYWCQLFGTSR